jgi:hypothetical protein
LSGVATLFIPGPLPGMNEMIAAAHHRRGKWDGYGALKRQWGAAVFAHAKSARMPAVPSPVAVTFAWREPARRRDIDNVAAGAKFVLDGLVKAGVIEGDGQRHIVRLEHSFGVDKERPGVLVTVSPEVP